MKRETEYAPFLTRQDMDTSITANEQAKKEIIAALDEFDNIIFFGFRKTGEACCLTKTNDAIYDKLALAITALLERTAREVEKEINGE